MKKLIVLLLAIALAYISKSQEYQISGQFVPSKNAYEYQIKPNKSLPVPTQDFTAYDLITWVFPDGQFKQWEIETDQPTGLGNVINNSDKVNWQPYFNVSGSGGVIAYVAKKGKPGNPSKNVEITPISTTVLASSPATFAMSTTAGWQINEAWELAPDKEVLLIVSYKTTCPAHNIKLSFPNQLSVNTSETLHFQNENIATMPAVSPKTIEISNINNNGVIHHVYVKVKVDNTVKVDDILKIDLTGNDCGVSFDTHILYRVKGNPHDPNEKISNQKFICPGNANTTDLNYYIKFQNNGDAPVNRVDVEDVFPVQIDPSTVSFNFPNSNKINKASKLTNGFYVEFKDLQLPGLKQTNPHYAYDQTTYSFTFDVCTWNSLPTGQFDNKVGVYFYNNQGILPVVYTNNSRVFVELTPPDCYLASVYCILPTIEQGDVINNLSTSPNPYTDEVQIFIDLAQKTRLNIVVRDLNGHIIDIVADGEFISGAHQISWNGGSLSTGIYLLDVYTEHGRSIRKVIKM